MLNRKPLLLIWISVLIILSSTQCKKDKKENRVYVDFTIDLTSIQYSDLNASGGWMYLNGGENGILVYRSIDDFYAYDRTCTLRSDSCKPIEMDKKNFFFPYDTKCKSSYSILDGTPHTGPSTRPLIIYHTSFDGHYLRVYN